MKQKTFLILLLAGGLLIGGAAAGYRILSANYTPDGTSSAQEHEKITAPDFVVQNQSGESVKLSDYFGKPIVLNFWATWCGPCKSELPAFDAAYHSYGDRAEFLFVNLTDGQRETVEVVEEFLAANDYTFPVYYDTMSSAANAYSVYGVPVTYFIHADGTVQDAFMGAMPADQLEQYLQKLLVE